MKEVRENSDLNKTLHFRVVLLVGNCKKLFFGVEQFINRHRTVMKSVVAIP